MTLARSSASPAIANSSYYGTNSASLTSNSFSPPAGSVIIVTVYGQNGYAPGGWGAVSLTDSLSTHLTWTRFLSEAATTYESAVWAWWAYTASAPGSMTVTATITAGGGQYVQQMELTADVWTGADVSAPAGATVSGTHAGQSLSVSLTPSASGSALIIAAADGANTGVQAAGSGCYMLAADSTNKLAGEAWYGTSGGFTPTVKSVAETLAITGGSASAKFEYIAYEVLAAPGVASTDSGSGHGAAAQVRVSAAAAGHGAGAAWSHGGDWGHAVFAASVSTGPAGVSAAAAGHGSAAAVRVTAVPAQPGPGHGQGAPAVRVSAAAAGHGSAAAVSAGLHGADGASAAGRVLTVRPQGSQAAGGARGAAQAVIRAAGADAGAGAGSARGAGLTVAPAAAAGSAAGGAVTSVRLGASGSASAGSRLSAGLSSAASGLAAFSGSAGPGGARTVHAAAAGRGQGSGFFFVAAVGHGGAAGGVRWSAVQVHGAAAHGSAAALRAWPSAGVRAHGSAAALSGWPAGYASAQGREAVMPLRRAGAAAASAAAAAPDVGIWTLLPPSWGERMGGIVITGTDSRTGAEVVVASADRPSAALLRLAFTVSGSRELRKVTAAAAGTAAGAVAREPAAVTVWVSEAVRVAVWVE